MKNFRNNRNYYGIISVSPEAWSTITIDVYDLARDSISPRIIPRSFMHRVAFWERHDIVGDRNIVWTYRGIKTVKRIKTWSPRR